MFDTGSLVPIVFLLTIAFTLVGLAKVIADARIRRRLIDAGVAPELARAIAGSRQEDPALYSTLKWGIVLGAVGLGLILVQFLPYRSGEPIVLGVILVFAAAGLLVYYASVRRLTHPSTKGGAA